MPQQPAAVRAAFARRAGPGRALADDADAVARACHDMALRFHRGGKLIVFGNGGSAADAQHVAVEFVHPVVVGKRALPAVCLTNDVATVTAIARTDGFDAVFATRLRLSAAPEDIALGICADGRSGNVLRGLRTAREMGLLTVALVGAGAEHGLAVDHLLAVRDRDPCVVKEVQVTMYHILWELVHVFVERPEVLR